MTTPIIDLTEDERRAGGWIDCRGHKRIPQQAFHHDGMVVYGQQAIEAGMRWIDSMHSTSRVRGRPVPIRGQRDREHRPAVTRRASSSSRTSSADPGDPDLGGPPASALRLAPAPRAVLAFGCITAEVTS